jgi:signal transduction histidine kinase
MISLLIADDDPDHLALARLALEDGLSNCVIDTADTGQMVLEAFATKSFDVVVLDYRLPDMDGLAVLDELRRQTKPPPVLILLTGLGSEEVAATALRLGADDYVPKVGNYATVLPAVIERAIERRRMETLERELEAQKAIQRNKLAFLQSVNHELRTPLTMIVGYAELLARRSCALEDVPSYCQEIYKYANRLSTLIERLLEAATLEPMEPAGMAVVRAADVREVLDAAIAAALEADPGCQIDIEGPEHAFALIDTSLFRRAVDEVLGNALKFSPPGEAVTVSVVLLVDSVAVIVKDRGPGIPPEERERVFLPFYRVENDSSITVRGLGLGLSRVRQVISAQGGQVCVEDTPPGTGTSVRMIFRRAALPDH